MERARGCVVLQSVLRTSTRSHLLNFILRDTITKESVTSANDSSQINMLSN